MGEIIFISEIWVEVKMEGCSLFYIFKRMLENMIFFFQFLLIEMGMVDAGGTRCLEPEDRIYFWMFEEPKLKLKMSFFINISRHNNLPTPPLPPWKGTIHWK